jgi:hypothetical protein
MFVVIAGSFEHGLRVYGTREGNGLTAEQAYAIMDYLQDDIVQMLPLQSFRFEDATDDEPDESLV